MFSSALKSFSSNITANYTLSPTPTSVAGAWKVYDGKAKKTGKTVSIFIFDRKSLEASGGGLDRGGNGSSRRKVHDEIVERLKKEASSLARLRHPSILELAEPVEETRSGGLMFATEPVTATLAGLLADRESREKGRVRNAKYRRAEDGEHQELELDELEIQKGLLQVAKGLQFLHESANLVHANLTPEAIYINHKSDWKISGLGFAGPSDESTLSASSASPPIALSELLYYDPRLPRTVQLDISYTSPDFVMDKHVSPAADMFSFGILLIALYSSPHESPLNCNGNISTYKKLFASSSTVPSANNNFLSSKTLPRQLKSDVLPKLITRRPAQRMSAREFQDSSFFDNVLVSTIRFLEALPAKTINEKSQFMRGFPRVIDQFPKSVLGKKVLPALLEETKDKELLSLILGNIFKIIAVLPSAQRVFADQVLPKLHEIFLITPIHKGERDGAREAGLAIMLENMNLVTEICSGKHFKDDILPIVILGLESPTHPLVDKSLNCLPKILTVLDFSTIKNELFPVIAQVFSKTSSLAIKVKGLEAFVTLCGGVNDSDATASHKANSSTILDKYTVQEKIVPLMKAIKTKEPMVMMASLAVFKQIGKIADSDFLAMEVLPIMWQFSLGPLLNLQQFSQYMDLIKLLSSRVEQEHTRKLRDLASNSAIAFDDPTKPGDLMSMDRSFNSSFSPGGSVGEDDFERLVLGRGLSAERPSTASKALPDSDPFGTHTGSQSQIFTWNSVNTGTLQPQKPSSRAITPDHALSAFTPLSPTSMASVNNNIPQTQGPVPQNINPWSHPAQPLNSPPSNNSWSTIQPQNGVNTSTQSATSWTVPQPPQAQNKTDVSSISGVNAGSLSQQPPRPLQPNLPTSSFNIAPPPTTSQSQWQQQQKQQTQPKIKTGLDAYESLL